MGQVNLVSGFAKAILEKYAEPVVKGLAETAKGEWEKFKIDFDVAFLEYLKNANEKYSKIKTILYRTEPKYIYDFFECPTLTKDHKEFIDGDDINNVTDISNFVIVQGTGGIGKSTFLKHLFINEVSHKDLIPVFIELKDLNGLNDYEICDFVFERLYDLGSTIDKKYMEYALKSGCFLFLLDGYDEILSEKKDVFFRKFESFCDRYSDNYFIITSRPYSEFVEFQRFTVLSMCNLSKKQATSLIRKVEFDCDVKQRFIEALESRLYDKHRSFASNPLLLNIMLLTFDNYAEIPEKLHLFYSNAFETLYDKHDATKAGYRRELRCKMSKDLFKRVFSYFCFVTYFQGKIEFAYDELVETLRKLKIDHVTFDITDYIYDLVNAICVLHRDGLRYKFTHRSFQEYFSAVFLKELSDQNMQTMGIKLIKKDVYRIADDEVFGMLRDMAEQRFEQNILLPILEEIESGCCDEDKYDFYFTKREPLLSFSKVKDDGEYRLFLTMSCADKLLIFLQKISYYYVSRDEAQLKKERVAEKTLCNVMVEHRGYQLRQHFNGMDFTEDKEVYSLIKDTWVGNVISTMAKLSSIISKKREETELDLDSLLI